MADRPFATPIASVPVRRARAALRRAGVGAAAPPDETWRARSSCRGLDPATFHPETDDEAGPAKQVCAQCAVREPCLEAAIAGREFFGVWGGLTARERKRLIRRRRESA